MSDKNDPIIPWYMWLYIPFMMLWAGIVQLYSWIKGK